MNEFKFMGYVGKIAFTSSTGGKKIARFSVGQTNSYKDKDGNKKEKTVWISNFVAWEKAAENMEKLKVDKGSRLLIDSRIENNNYEKNGTKFYSYQFVVNKFYLLDKKEDTPTTESPDIEKEEVVEHFSAA